MTRAVTNAVHIPVIASGAVGRWSTLQNVFTQADADAALAASLSTSGN